ncbi:16S rRNA (adenine(1518)-N(6)/adenine(1519)-N(6))-dimethyltransferase RsmA [Marinicella rhabdoformis]|uniref:16S rRNA (adenine(1518)-N(6)/adenine(1519)-N(6))- dimethyltransferase RsmA n=1 Tax=Marinicella rhabdoformis TaxID=2580566 RepID=UPI0012AEBEA7|nr:16S rRNA (adenine(1518)-N(6)/adenine(1519)-N(6))-dimethyltransferase RsmA [Marinicella rhabdoformis]
MKAKKHLGQNFLKDDGVINNIVKIIRPKQKERIIEIGPGHGAITQYIQASEADLQLIELDNDLIPVLEQKFGPAHNVQIHHMDALQLQLTDGPYKVVGNLPYNISTPLLINMLYQAKNISTMVFMLQKEVVQRICAPPGEKNFGRLSVMLQHQFDCTAHLVIKPEAFDPPPKIDSQIVQLTTKSEVNTVSLPALELLVKQSFQQRRKTIRNNLKKIVEVAQLEAVGIDPKQRPETVTVKQYEELTKLLEATKA